MAQLENVAATDVYVPLAVVAVAKFCWDDRHNGLHAVCMNIFTF